ncbi:hypothetical protein Tcan_15625 [Toxocara canis]|uniref:Uncharacterized protein n=1 Tax=Toxocara canis TaxID=6265 RepID=A0A0B2VHM7_TOXCA|nr:hypothetical protein Tcan_15625 [Toxocara canis]
MGEAEAISHEGKEDTRPRDALEGEVLKDVKLPNYATFVEDFHKKVTEANIVG